MAPAGCFLSSVALSTAPCQGSSGPFWLGSCLLLLHHQGTTRALALSGSFPLQVCSGSELCSSLGSISPGVLACAKPPVLGRAPGLLHHQVLPLFQLFLHAGQAQEHFSCVTGQEAQRRNFLKAKRTIAINMCNSFENTPRYHTPLLLLRVISTNPHSPNSHSSGNRDCLACIPAATFCSSVAFLCQTARDVFSS